MDTHSDKSAAIQQIDAVTDGAKSLLSSRSSPVHAAPEVIRIGDGAEGERAGENTDESQASKGHWFAYLKTKNFYLVLLLGYDFTKCLMSPEGVVTYAEVCAIQPNLSSLPHSHQYLLFAPCGTILLYPCFPNSVELYPPYTGLWLLHNL